jgi:hypothetical protein
MGHYSIRRRMQPNIAVKRGLQPTEAGAMMRPPRLKPGR